MKNLKNKKLLVLGGVYQHCKLVEAAHELGAYVIVDDYLPPEQAPAKQMADKHYMHNIFDIDDIVAMCRKEKVDGVIATSLDACQRPYQQICEKLGLPCFGTKEQYTILTDKNAFKAQCRKSGLDVIPEYAEEDFVNKEICAERVKFPILVKPCDSRGSRGQSICNTYDEVIAAIEFARGESSTHQVVIEKYMGQSNDFSMTILVVNGKAYPYRTLDRVLGTYEDGLDKLAVGSVTPSVFSNLYMNNVHKKVKRFIQDVGLVTAPIFMQGFVDGDTIRFYDPGLRLPGSEFERTFCFATGKNVLYPLIEYALTGKASDDAINMTPEDIWFDNKVAVQVLVALRPGKIAAISGVDEIRNHPKVAVLFERLAIGDEVQPTHNVKQRFCEIYLVCDDNADAAALTEWVYETLKVTDAEGESMVVSKINTALFAQRVFI